MKTKFIKTLFLTSLITMSLSSFTFAKGLSQDEFIKNLENTYNVEIELNQDNLTDMDLINIKNKIETMNLKIENLKKELSVPEYITFNKLLRASQNYSGTAVVDASVPAIGFYKIFIPYRYTVVTSGGAPYFSNARADGSYAGGLSIGTWSCYSSWTEIYSRNGRRNNVLDINTKGSITYSVGPGNVTLPNQVFVKTFYL